METHESRRRRRRETAKSDDARMWRAEQASSEAHILNRELMYRLRLMHYGKRIT